MKVTLKTLVVIFLTLVKVPLTAQEKNSVDSLSRPDMLHLAGTDSFYVAGYTRGNDVRLFYGGEGASLAYGSTRKDDTGMSTTLYHNATDMIGFGLSYKIIDFDLGFSLPSTRLMEDDRENLSQFRMALSYTTRKYSVRGFLVDYHGMIASDAGEEFESNADVRLFRMGGQLTYFFNNKKYSYRAANSQSERQKKTAGSLLVRLEPSYRKIETATRLVPQPRDLPEIYGEQTGLHYVNAFGLLVLPGYGVNIVTGKGKWFVSPYAVGGPGFALNQYEGDQGKFSSLNWEWSASLSVAMGYNGERFYATLRTIADWYYIQLNPSFFSSSYLKIGITAGYRFRSLEKTIPSSVF